MRAAENMVHGPYYAWPDLPNVVLDLGRMRWAGEPVGPDTLARFTPTDKPKRQMREGVWVSLWELKKSEGQ